MDGYKMILNLEDCNRSKFDPIKRSYPKDVQSTLRVIKNKLKWISFNEEYAKGGINIFRVLHDNGKFKKIDDNKEIYEVEINLNSNLFNELKVIVKEMMRDNYSSR